MVDVYCTLQNMRDENKLKAKWLIIFLILGLIVIFFIFKLFLNNNSSNYKPTPSDYYTY